jgi:hypothetical protein
MRIRGLFLSGYLIEVVQSATGNPSNALTTRQRGLLALSDPQCIQRGVWVHVSDAQGLLEAE